MTVADTLRRIGLASLVLAPACSSAGSERAGEVVHQELETVTVASKRLTFYIHLDRDSAVLGFSEREPSGQLRYFPLYASSYRGLPEGTLEVLVSPTKDAIWVTSSWPGYEILGYRRFDTDLCVTRYGEIDAQDTPAPDVLGGEPASFPALDRTGVEVIATLKIPKT